MIIHEGNPQSFLRHFHTGQSHMVIALLVLSLDIREREAVLEMLDRMPQLDDVLGEEIGLYFFSAHPGKGLVNRRPLGEVEVMLGEEVVPRRRRARTTTARDFFENLSSSGYTEDDRRLLRARIARTTIEIVPDFCRAFGLISNDLPVVCAIVRGSDQVVTAKIRADDVLPRLIEAANLLDREIAAIQLDLNIIVSGAYELESQLNRVLRYETKCKEIVIEIKNFLDSLERKFDVSITPQIMGLIRSGELTPAALEEIVSQCADSSVAFRLRSDSRIQAIKKRLIEWQEAEDEIQAFAKRHDWPALLANRDLILSNVDRIQGGVTRAFSGSGISTRTYGDGWIKRAVTFVRVVGKGAEIARKLHGIP